MDFLVEAAFLDAAFLDVDFLGMGFISVLHRRLASGPRDNK